LNSSSRSDSRLRILKVCFEEKEDLNERHTLLESDMETLQENMIRFPLNLDRQMSGVQPLRKEIENLLARIADLEREGREKEEELSKATNLLEGERKEKKDLNDQLAAFKTTVG